MARARTVFANQQTPLACCRPQAANKYPAQSRGANMSTPEARQKTLFLNGVETESIEPTGDAVKDLAAARRFLAEKGIDKPQQRLTLGDRIRSAWRRKFL